LHTAELTYKLIKQVKDERFDEDKIHQYALLINLGPRDVQFAVIDPSENRVLSLEDYVFPKVTSHQDLIQSLEQLYESHAYVKAGFWQQITVCLKNQNFVQVPQALFSEDALEDYLKFNTHTNANQEDFIPVFLKNSQAVTVFAIHKDLKAWFQSAYPSQTPSFVHQSGALIEGAMEMAKNYPDNPLILYIDRFKLHILSIHNGKLIYYNQFLIKQFSDYVKYIMLVMKSLNINQQEGKVVMWGYIGNNSPHFQEFYKYISNVTIGQRPTHLVFAYPFDEIQDHHYFDLYSISLCS
jgi:hypothetical protein